MSTPVLDPVSAVQAAAFRVALRQRLTEKYGLPSLAESWKPFCPLAPTLKQGNFLALDCREALYGGAAGPGKSVALLMGALQYVGQPHYAALLLRKNFSDLSLPGALMDMAATWLRPTVAQWHAGEKTWRFPSGASLTFGFLDNAQDKYRYQSAEFQFVGFDELTQFPESDYLFLFSRLRRLQGVSIPIRMRSASNPGNIGHDWVKQRFMVEANPDRVFLPATLADNPHLDRAEYEKTLAELDPITRQQMLNGDWTARAGGNKFKREWFEIVDVAPAVGRRVRFWDMAATEPKPGRDPDWTAGCLMIRTPANVLYLADMRRMRGTPGANETMVKQTAEVDSTATAVRMEQEPGSSGVKAIDDYRRRVLLGWDFQGVPSTGSKEVRANPLASQAQAGNIKLVRGPWVMAFLDEAELFPHGSHDDQIDAASGALTSLRGGGIMVVTTERKDSRWRDSNGNRDED